MAPPEAQMPFIKNLASSDRKLRTASLESLQLFLSTRSALTVADASKLWKGLYYAHWMSDRPLPQQRLANELAALADALPNAACLAPWFDGFWTVLGQEWPMIDKLRLDKFLLLVRRVFAVQLRCARKHGDDVERTLQDWPFEASGDLRKVPLGLRLHIMDIWVDELERAELLAPEHGEFVARIGVMVEGLKHCPIKQVRERARESHDDPRLPWGVEKEVDEDEDEEWGGLDD
ncbi:Ribosomal RNA-processing protein-like protein [Emericellopsis cladophorae]|uniref:Ribosomal RNA-processing protein-like protein n=1 Tax=Emericellopsis cladophorae TaxID=2686198 RepID=A0A9Q0BAP1_9HYPO|nr:Ribosomal RNA-processing protein-like protein [Emericellopsis cladophorae]KAI6777906.1 Ribosomal RNA-processing protein-like protein [Emericellopsis cladophorae]